MSISIILVNAGGLEEAEQIGRVLVESRLAAGVNMVDGVSSIFRWNGTVRQRTETQLIIKTRADLVDIVIARVRELHSYDCPAILALPVADGNPDYLAWVARDTTGR